MADLTDAQVLLLAAQLISLPDLVRLRPLAATRQDVLSASILYRVLLTYLPLDSDVEVEHQLVSFLQDLYGQFRDFSTLDTVSQEKPEVLGAFEAENALSSLSLEKVPVYDSKNKGDPLSDFLIAWLHRVERFGGLPASAQDLIEPFLQGHDSLRQWASTYMQPLCRLQNDYYTDQASSLSLTDVETLHGETGVATLLQYTVDKQFVKRDLEEVVTPWVSGAKRTKRRRLSVPGADTQLRRETDWSDVNEWLVSTAQKDYGLAAAAAETWNGPTPNDSSSQNAEEQETDHEAAVAYVRAVLALIYISDGTDGAERISQKVALLQRAANLAQLMPPDVSHMLPEVPNIGNLQDVPRSDLFQTALLTAQNQLTRPSTDNIDFLHGVLSTQKLLDEFKLKSTTRAVASTTLIEPEEKQKQELQQILNQIPRLTRSSLRWSDIRERLLWLRNWSGPSDSQKTVNRCAYLSHVSSDYLDEQILDAILSANDYQSVKDIYLAPETANVSAEKLQEHIKASVLNAYDNASNGNRTRGGVKKASDLITAFRSDLHDPPDFEHLEYLIKATHSLSFYHLTLQYGVPFQPVNIRVSNDPLSLVEKVLDQNNKAYTKLDDLLAIARNLILADLPVPPSPDYPPGEVPPLDRRLFDAEHRITYSAINAALTDDDFNTAYSLITTRLNTTLSRSITSSFSDDTSWRAAYAAGKHRATTPSNNIHARISALQKRMELLSTALTLAPTADPLPEILTAWRRLEEELDSLKSQALEEERALDAQSEQALPGGFGPSDQDLDANETRRLLDSRRSYNTTSPSYEEEAPMGLFDVARGAASALGKHAFPLRGAQGHNVRVRASDQSRTSMGDSMTSSGELERPGSADGQRVRKRDMLSNAVTGGLVSGMSWVLGAPPPQQAARQ